MRSISTRLFLAFLTILAVVVAGMGLATRWSFERGFIGYLNEQGEARMTEVLPRVQQAYAFHGSWDFLRHDRGAWFALMRPAGMPAIRDIESDPPTPTNSDLTGVVIRMGLLDAQQQFVAGYREVSANMPSQAVVVDGLTVGWLVLAPFEEGTEAADQRFQRSQTRSMAGVAVAGAADGGRPGLVALAPAHASGHPAGPRHPQSGRRPARRAGGPGPAR